MKPLLLSIFLSCGADATSTHLALTHGAHELVLPSQNPWVIDGIVAGESAAIAFGLHRLHKTHPKLAKALGWSIVGMRSSIAAYNFRH
jgi:hypothetical protein